MTDTPELFSGLLWHSVPGGVLPIRPLPRQYMNLTPTAGEAYAHATGYREGLEAAAAKATEQANHMQQAYDMAAEHEHAVRTACASLAGQFRIFAGALRSMADDLGKDRKAGE